MSQRIDLEATVITTLIHQEQYNLTVKAGISDDEIRKKFEAKAEREVPADDCEIVAMVVIPHDADEDFGFDSDLAELWSLIQHSWEWLVRSQPDIKTRLTAFLNILASLCAHLDQQETQELYQQVSKQLQIELPL